MGICFLYVESGQNPIKARSLHDLVGSTPLNLPISPTNRGEPTGLLMGEAERSASFFGLLSLTDFALYPRVSQKDRPHVPRENANKRLTEGTDITILYMSEGRCADENDFIPPIMEEVY